MRYTLLFILTLFCAQIAESTPYAQQDKTVEKLDSFEKALDWLSLYREQLAEEQRETLESVGLFSELQEANQAFTEEVKNAQRAFEEFRGHIYQLVLSTNVGDPQVGPLLIGVQAELVDWYIAYMENLLFPKDWKESFQAYLEEQGLSKDQKSLSNDSLVNGTISSMRCS